MTWETLSLAVLVEVSDTLTSLDRLWRLDANWFSCHRTRLAPGRGREPVLGLQWLDCR